MDSLVEKSKRKSFSVFETALACVLFILFNFIFEFFLYLIPSNVVNIPVVYYLLSFLAEFVFAVAAWTVAKSRGVEIVPATGVNKKVNGKIVLIGFLISLVCLMFFASLSNVFSDFLIQCGYHSSLSASVADRITSSFWAYLASIVVTCIAPAIFEELLFRGVVLSGLKEYGQKIAVIVSALIFMLMHGNADQTVHQFIIGLVVGYIFIKSGNLWIGVIVHFFNNFIAITETYILTLVLKNIDQSLIDSSGEVAVEIPVNPWVSLLIEFVVALVTAYIGFIIIRMLVRKVNEESHKLNDKVTAKTEESTILVDGEQIETEIVIEGENVGENSAENLIGSENATEKPQLTAGVIIMFVLAGASLIADWVMSLVSGFIR